MSMRERDGGDKQQGGAVSAREPVATPGKLTLTAGMPVQMRGAASPPPAAAVHDAAARGVATPTTALPHGERIQAAFGAAHDVSSIQAHVGGGAADACADMGASAFASGSHAVFAQTPDLHTAAHEAAHVVQQAQGVNLYGGVGSAGDADERHADAVADRVVAGHSVADLFGARSAPSSGASGAVQKKDGEITHKGKAGAGKVTARKNDVDPSDKTDTNYSLEYAGKDADKAHWLQFVFFQRFADVPGSGRLYDTGVISTTSGDKPYSTDKVTHWSVDSADSADPYYEATGSNVRTPAKSTKVFDMPGATSASRSAQFAATKAPKATKVTFFASFDSYLVLDGKAIYHVIWNATAEYDPVAKTLAPIAYGTGDAGSVAALPKNLKTVLDTQYAGNKIQ